MTRIGIHLPQLVERPTAAAFAEAVECAVAAERLGYDFCTCSEHVAVPVDVAAVRGATYWDPLSTFGYLAARTARIRFATFVLVLGYHHPLEVAKRYGTLDRVSSGRLVLGVGVGSLEDEFVLLGAEFLAVIQILVYAGGIVVLYLFVVMLVNLKRPPEAHQDPHRMTRLGFGMAAAVLIELGMIAAYGATAPITRPAVAATAAIPVSGNTEQVGWLLYTSYLIPFEIASMLLLVAMIGAIVLAKREL